MARAPLARFSTATVPLIGAAALCGSEKGPGPKTRQFGQGGSVTLECGSD